MAAEELIYSKDNLLRTNLIDFKSKVMFEYGKIATNSYNKLFNLHIHMVSLMKKIREREREKEHIDSVRMQA